uniref:WGS project CAEQ00000000 data, annotated contig 634 n=1 Tax=Trypanosoma congolense (strain IL3000) TaxID=1068625 RepID=F9WHE5_TRYCI|nr:unnamed protein product [Trypanosoma congolense IL3000]
MGFGALEPFGDIHKLEIQQRRLALSLRKADVNLREIWLFCLRRGLVSWVSVLERAGLLWGLGSPFSSSNGYGRDLCRIQVSRVVSSECAPHDQDIPSVPHGSIIAPPTRREECHTCHPTTRGERHPTTRGERGEFVYEAKGCTAKRQPIQLGERGSHQRRGLASLWCS